jgi:hypothetical protein
MTPCRNAEPMTVTYRVARFTSCWGWPVLGGTVAPAMTVAGIVILPGTAQATGAVGPRRDAVDCAR